MRFQKKLAIFSLASIAFSFPTSAQTLQDTTKALDAIFDKYHPGNPGCELAISRNG